MVTEVDAATALVLTGKVALVAPSGTVTLAGTVAAASLLARETTAPSRGAGALSVTVPVEERPPVTLVGPRLSEERMAGVLFIGVLLISIAMTSRTGPNATAGVTGRSSLPSPLKSPTATDTGALPAVKVSAARKVPSPLPNSTETSLEA